MVIQRAWRFALNRREIRKRVVAMRLARECMTVVLTRERILWAKGIIVMFWREGKKTTERKERSQGILKGSPEKGPGDGDLWLSL